MRLICAIFTALLLCSSIAAQSSKPPDPSPRIRLHLDDASTVRGSLLTDSIEIATAYGPLTIPVSEIRSIKFGLHNTTTDADAIQHAIRSLGSPVHRDRVAGADLLTLRGRRAIPSLLVAMRSTDVETKRAAKLIHGKLTEADSRCCDVATVDRIDAKAGTFTGLIRTPMLKVRSTSLGELSIGITDCAVMACLTVQEGRFKVDAEQFGSGDATRWFSTGIIVDAGAKITVMASGSCELWPKGPGQYITTPKGYGANGKGSPFSAGALIGRFGDGAPFFIGETHTSEARMSGTLLLQIVPSPWGDVSDGVYSVDVVVRSE